MCVPSTSLDEWAYQGWQAIEYVDEGISDAKDRRPALDRLMADAKRRKVDVVVCWKLDRFGISKSTSRIKNGFPVEGGPRFIPHRRVEYRPSQDGTGAPWVQTS